MAVLGVSLCIWAAGAAAQRPAEGPAEGLTQHQAEGLTQRPTEGPAQRPAQRPAEGPAQRPAGGAADGGSAGAPPPARRPAPAPADETARLFDNPAACAVREHRLGVSLDPDGAQLRARGAFLLLHPPGVPADRAVPLLLHRDLRLEQLTASHRGESLPLRWERRARWEPRDFWPDPEYPGLAEYDHASQIDLLLETRAAWPESLWIELAWSGTLYDSLRPPRENYQRGFETTRGLIDPRGAYLSGYSLWYPRRFDPPSPFSLSVDLPAGWMAVSQGRMVEGPNGERTAGSPRAGDDAADPSGAGDRAAEPPGARDAAGAASAAWDPPGAGLRRMTWDSPEPMDEIYLVAGPYTLREADHRGIAIQTFTYGRDDEELCRTYLAATGEYLDLYDDLIGPYPFPKFALVENFWQTGYGMPSFTLLGDRVLRLPFIVKTSYGHEILHNWWGNGVYVDTAEGNWCEGLTVYGADYLYKERESEAAAREYRRNQLQGYLDYVRHGRDFPLTEFRERHDAASAAIGYGKSMMLFHMLRRRLGDEAFRAGLRDFYERHLFRGATWDDLLAALAAGGEFDPEAFRAQWIERPGAPLLTLEEVDLSFSRTGGVELRYRLTQSEPLYDLAVPVRASFPDRTAESWVVKLSGPAHEETRLLQATPISLEVDPDFDICRRLHRAEVPATLSRLFGADSLTVVAGGGAGEGGGGAGEGDEAFAEICARLAGELPGQTTALRSDEELGWFDLRSSAWLLGEPRWMARVREAAPRLLALDGEGFCIGEDVFSYTTHTLACVLGHPGVPDAAVGLLLGGDPGDWPEIWRRLPHYGSYSYLVFEGGRNVAKGAWPVERSPLKVVWEGGQ